MFAASAIPIYRAGQEELMEKKRGEINTMRHGAKLDLGGSVRNIG